MTDFHAAPKRLTPLAVRGVVGGVLMGLANLVPGISGGTMRLAAGIYPRFITAISDVVRFRNVRFSCFVIGVVALSALVAIGLLAGVVKTLVVEHRWIMYSLFIGLTLGGVPVVWSLLRPANRAVWIGAACGFAAMAALAWVQLTGAGEGGAARESVMFMFLAGVAGASAMILPGVSGGYLLLVLGVYVPILGGIDAVKQAIGARDLAALGEPMMQIVLPVGVGVVIGIVVVSNALRVLLERYEKATLGVLLGLLVGAVVGLWPFQRGVAPAVGEVFRGQVMTAQLIAALDAEKYPTQFFTPTAAQVGIALAIVVAGFVATALLARLGNAKTNARPAEAA